jgi:2-polyprenyl-3-methyl-5-hydroxy-6-metoxy-1,4-benzoquinol methylase
MPASDRPVKVRSGKELTLWHCSSCDYDFFTHDPTAGLAADKLDQSRLKAAGLDIPTLERDFANGIAQSRRYIAEHLDEACTGANVLEIGCSWGYLLKLARDAGANPYGVEINILRARYVNDVLKIPCDTRLEDCEARGVRFRTIFLLYVLEYVPDPVAYLQRLVDLLEEGGKLVFVTPNLSDAIKDLWCNQAFGRFFYDEHSINYLTQRSVERIVERLRRRDAVVATRQGYSFVNHVSWFLTQAPRTTGVVGGDNFVDDIVALLRATPSVVRDDRQRAAATQLADLIASFDRQYRRLLETNQYGNQVHCVVHR